MAERAGGGDALHDGIVTVNYGKEVQVLADGDIMLTCELASELELKPVPGDHVRFERTDGGNYLRQLLPRERVIRRAGRRDREHRVLAAHVDCMVIVSAIRPVMKEGLIDRYLVIAAHAGIDPIPVLNKTDLDKPDIVQRFGLYAALGYPAFAVSAYSGENVDALKEALTGKTSVLVGHSGVGKSTLLMAMIPGIETAIADISEYSGKGVHTTSTARMWVGDGLRIIDSPGIRALQLADIEPGEVREYFIEFKPHAAECRFRNCLHIDDAGCAVRQAVAQGDIRQVRYDSYVRLVESLRTAG